MKSKILILFAIIVGTHCNVSFQGQELPDTVWTTKGDFSDPVKFDLSEKYIFTSWKQNVFRIDVKTGLVTDTFDCYCEHVNRIAFSPTGDTVIFSGGLDKIAISLFNSMTLDTFYTLKVDSNSWGSEAFITPDGKRIIATTNKTGFDVPKILIIDLYSKEIIKTITGSYAPAISLKISPDGKYICYTEYYSDYISVVLMDLNSYEEIKRFQIYPHSNINRIAFSPDSKLLAYISEFEGIFIWDLQTLKLVKKITFYNILDMTYRFENLLFSNDSKYLIFSHFEDNYYKTNKIIVWDINQDTIASEYMFPGNLGIDLSSNNFMASVGWFNHYEKNGVYLFLLRPKWTGTDVIEPKTEGLSYSINNGILKIKFEETITEKPEINIYNILGVVAHCNVPVQNGVHVQNGNEIEIDLNYLNSGVFFVVVDVDGKRRVVKVMRD